MLKATFLAVALTLCARNPAFAQDIVKQMREITGDDALKPYLHYWVKEIEIGGEGKFYAYLHKVDDDRTLVFTQLRTGFNCDTPDGGACDSKVMLLRKNGDFKTLLRIYLDLARSSISLDDDPNSDYPIIKITPIKHVYKYGFDAKKGVYDFTADSPRPKKIESISPRNTPFDDAPEN